MWLWRKYKHYEPFSKVQSIKYRVQRRMILFRLATENLITYFLIAYAILIFLVFILKFRRHGGIFEATEKVLIE